MSAVPAMVRDVVSDVVPNKVLDALAPAGAALPQPTAEDSPNEYRDLLISLSGDKSDHILWLQCLMTCARRGDGEFSFTLDKCGVPMLRGWLVPVRCRHEPALGATRALFQSGDYFLNLSYDCLDANLLKSRNDCRLHWEGPYVDGRVGEQALVDVHMLTILVNKCVNVLKAMGVEKGTRVVLYMPSVLQLPVAVMACTRVGALLTYVNSGIHSEPAMVTKLFSTIRPEVIVTVDAFLLGENVHWTKKLVDQVVHHMLSDGTASSACGEAVFQRPKTLMVQHIGADPGVPPPVSPLSRRPLYGIDVPFDPDWNYRWADEMSAASEQCEIEWMDSEVPIFRTFHKDHFSGEYHFEVYTVGQIALITKLLASKLSHSTGPVWPLADSDDLLYLSCILAAPMTDSPLLLCEGSPIHPDASRFFEIIERNSVEVLVIAEEYTKLLMRNEEFEHLWRSVLQSLHQRKRNASGFYNIWRQKPK